MPKNTVDLCPVIDLSHLNDHLVIHNSRWKLRHESGRPSKTTNRSCPSTYRIHICTSHGNACTEIPLVHSQWSSVPDQLGHLPLGIYQGGKMSPKGQSPCLRGLMAYLLLIPCAGQFGPASVAAFQLDEQFKQVWFATQPAVQFHRYDIQYVHIHHGIPAPNGGQNPEQAGSLEIAHPRITTRDLHRLLGMLTFMVTLVPRGQFCLCPIQWWASEAWYQETGSWSDRISVTPNHSPSGGLVVIPCRGSHWVP